MKGLPRPGVPDPNGDVWTEIYFGLLETFIVTSRDYVPMPTTFKNAILVVAVILLVLWRVQVFALEDMPPPRYHYR